MNKIVHTFLLAAGEGAIVTLAAARRAVEDFGAVVRPLDHGFDGRENYARWILVFRDGSYVLAVAGDGRGRHEWPPLAKYLGSLQSILREDDEDDEDYEDYGE